MSRFEGSVVRKLMYVVVLLAISASAWPTKVSAADKELRIDRIPDKRGELFYELVVKPWAEKTGVKVIQGSYNSDEQMLANIRATPGAYDLMYGGGSSIYRGIKQNLLEPFDLSKIPNYTRNVQEKYQHHKMNIGPGIHHLADAPGVFVAVYAADKFDSPPAETYAMFHDPKYKGHFAVRDYAIYEILMNAAYLGYDIEKLSLTPDDEEKVFAELRKQRNLVRTYWKSAAENRTLLANREVWFSDYWISPTLDQQDSLKIKWYLPKEGTPMWVQGWALAKNSKHKEEAESLMNYYYDPAVFMKYKEALASDVIILKDDVYDHAGFETKFPDLAKMGRLVTERGKDMDPLLLENKEAKWTERFQEIKLGGN